MVTIASLLLLTAAAAFAVYFLAVMAVYETIDQVYREVYTDSQASDLAPVMAGAYAVPALLLLCFGLILVLLAWRTYRGGRTARGWTITLTLFTLCCCGASAAFSSVSYDGLDATEWDQVRAAASQRLAETLPAWFEVISSATVGIGLGALLVATVLLVTGPSNRFFRRRGPMVLSPYPEHPYRPR